MNQPSWPWQLYLFCLVHLAAGLVCYADLCSWVFMKCNATEAVFFRFFGMCLLYVAVLFGVLSIMNRNEKEKLKRLAVFATYASVVLFTGLVMTGSARTGGYERPWMHIGDVIFTFVLFLIMATAYDDDTEAAPCTSPFRKLGINPKTFLLLITIAALVKLFVITDFVNLTDFMEDAKMTEFGRIMWMWMAVFIFDIFLVLWFTLSFGSAKDQEAITITVVVMSIVGLLSCIGMLSHFKAGLLRMSIPSVCVIVALAIIAVIGGRRAEQREGYEAV